MVTYKKKAFHFLYFFLFSIVFSCFSQAAEGVILIPNSRNVKLFDPQFWGKL